MSENKFLYRLTLCSRDIRPAVERLEVDGHLPKEWYLFKDPSYIGKYTFINSEAFTIRSNSISELESFLDVAVNYDVSYYLLELKPEVEESGIALPKFA